MFWNSKGLEKKKKETKMGNSDISPAMALGALAITAMLFLGLQHYDFLVLNWKSIVFALESSSLFLTTLIGAIVLNVLVPVVLLERTFGYKKQGSRLRSLKKSPLLIRKALGKTVLSGIVAFFLYGKAKAFGLENSVILRDLISLDYYSTLIDLFSTSASVTVAILLYILLSIFLKLGSILKLKSGLPYKTTLKNHLTLGSIGEEKPKFGETQSPKWVVIPEKALNGNILVTGSIGTGKTQGTILTYVDQLFRNFKQTPTALILDPKGSFINNVAGILEKRGLQDRCILLGDVHANI